MSQFFADMVDEVAEQAGAKDVHAHIHRLTTKTVWGLLVLAATVATTAANINWRVSNLESSASIAKQDHDTLLRVAEEVDIMFAESHHRLGPKGIGESN